MVALVIGLAALDDTVRRLLSWDRQALADGEWWRLVSGHLIHLDGYHAALNVVAAILLAALVGKVFRTLQVLYIIGIAVIAIDAGLWWLSAVDWYVGLSGVLHALAAAALVRRLLEQHDVLAWALAIFGLGKILWENTLGALPFTPSSTMVVTDAHLYGVLAGMLAGLLLRPVSAAA